MTGPLTAEQRGDLAERMLPVAARLALIVHGEGGQADVEHALARLTPAQKDALIVVLAALVDPDREVGDALGFVTWDEHGAPAEPEASVRSIRALAGHGWNMPSGAEDVFLREDVLRARKLHELEGRTLTEVAQSLGRDPRTVLRWKQDGWRRAA